MLKQGNTGSWSEPDPGLGDRTGEARGKWITNRLNGYRELGHDLVSWAAGQSPGEAAEPKKGRRKGHVASGFWRCLI